MATLNLNALVLVVFCTVVGALLGSALAGLAVGLGICLVGTIVVGIDAERRRRGA